MVKHASRDVVVVSVFSRTEVLGALRGCDAVIQLVPFKENVQMLKRSSLAYDYVEDSEARHNGEISNAMRLVHGLSEKMHNNVSQVFAVGRSD